jgi:hypothetical protein
MPSALVHKPLPGEVGIVWNTTPVA